MARSRAMRRGERGSALPLTVFVLVILGGLMLALLLTNSRDAVVASNHVQSTNALAAAEAGIAHAIDALNGPVVGVLPQNVLTGQAFGIAGFTDTVQIANNNVAGAGFPADAGGAENDTDGILVLTSTGRLPGSSNSTSINCAADDRACRQVQVWIRRGSPSPFQRAIWADVGINMSSSSGTDSYDSASGAYPGWGSAGSNGDVFSNGNITMSGSSLVRGDGAAGGTISGGSSHFTGTMQNGASPVTMESIDCPGGPSGAYTAASALPLPCAGCSYTGASGNLSVSGGHNINLPATQDYYFNQLSLSGGSTVTVCQYAGPLVGGNCPTSGSAAPHVNIFIAQTLSASGGSIVNPSSNSTKLTIIGCGSNNSPWTLSGGSGAYYGLYAPNHNLTLSGASDIWGAIVADFDTESAGSHIHYDEALSRSTWVFTGSTTRSRGRGARAEPRPGECAERRWYDPGS